MGHDMLKIDVLEFDAEPLPGKEKNFESYLYGANIALAVVLNNCLVDAFKRLGEFMRLKRVVIRVSVSFGDRSGREVKQCVG